MFKSIAFALLVICASASFQDTKQILAQIDQDKFGNTLMSAVQLNLASKAPLDDISLLLDQIIDNLETQISDANEENAKRTAECESTITSLKAQQAATEQKIAQLTEQIANDEEILTNAKVDLAEAKQDYEETVQSIETGTAERKAAHEKWANEDYEQTIQITTLDEGTKLINHMLHGVAFSQIEARYEKVLDKLKTSKGNHAGLFKPLVTSLTQIASKLNYDNVMNILKLLGDIRASIVQSQTAAREEEEHAQAEWEHTLATLEAQKKALAEKKARLANLIAATEKKLAAEKKSLENAKLNLENIIQSLAEKVAQCEKYAADYAAFSAEADRELGLLNKLREYINEKAAAVAEYAANRAANAPAF